MENSIKFFEELSLNAHCALKVQLYDGWVLRFNEGHTKRANSVSPLYDSTSEIGEKILYCEEQYAKHGLPCIFKLTDKDTALDEMLCKRGYVTVDPTDIMTLGITEDIQTDEEYISYAKPDENWLRAYFEYEGISDSSKRELVRKMFQVVTADTIYGAIKHEGKIVSCASAAIERGHVLIQNVVTDPENRRKGFAEKVCSSLIREAESFGAHTAYLQVVRENTAAVRLYEKLGYTKIYSYWYMKK